MSIPSVRQREIVNEIKTGALSTNSPEAMLLKLSQVNLGVGLFSNIKNIQALFAQAAMELAEGRKAVQSTTDDANGQTAAKTAGTTSNPVHAMKEKTAELRTKNEELQNQNDLRKAENEARAKALIDGFEGVAQSGATKTFAGFVFQKNIADFADRKPNESLAVPLLEYTLPKVKVDANDFSGGISSEMAKVVYLVKYSGISEGKQQILMTPHGLRLYGGKTTSGAVTAQVDVKALAQAGISLEQLQSALAEAMQHAVAGDVTTVKVKINATDRLSTKGMRAPLPPSTWDGVRDGLNNRFYGEGAQQIINDIAAKAPTMTGADFIDYAAGTLNMIGNSAQHQDGGDYKLPLALRDIMRIMLEIGVQSRINNFGFETGDRDKVFKAASYVSMKCHSGSSSYKTFEPNGKETQDDGIGWSALWHSVCQMYLPDMGPSWDMARQLGWSNDKSQAKAITPRPDAA